MFGSFQAVAFRPVGGIVAANLKNAKDAGKGVPEKGGSTFEMKWALAAVAMTIICFGSVVGGFLFVKNFMIKPEVKTQFVEKRIAPGPSFPLMNSQVVNLNGGRYLRFSCSIQYVENERIWPHEGGGGNAGPKKVDPLLRYNDMMKDVVVSTISRHTATELMRPEGKERLKEEIKLRINQMMSETAGPHADPLKQPVPEVYRIFFTEFVVS